MIQISCFRCSVNWLYQCRAIHQIFQPLGENRVVCVCHGSYLLSAVFTLYVQFGGGFKGQGSIFLKKMSHNPQNHFLAGTGGNGNDSQHYRRRRFSTSGAFAVSAVFFPVLPGDFRDLGRQLMNPLNADPQFIGNSFR